MKAFNVKFKAIIILSLCILLSACSNSNYELIKYKNVDVVELKSENRPLYFHYIGTVMPVDVKKYAFQVGGLINDIPVNTGDFVKAGDLLASLDVQKYNIAVNSSTQAQNQAYNNYIKARDSYNYLKKELDDLKSLLESGAASQSQYDQLALKTDIAQQELAQASSVYEQSKLKSSLDNTQKSDTKLYSDIDGQILQVMNAEGEVVGAGYPVIVVGSNEKQISLGVSSNDIKHIKQGSKALIELGGKQIEASVKSVSAMPNPNSQNYEVKVRFESDPEDEIIVGELVNVKIFNKTEEGVWIKFAHIQNDGRDYVYIARLDNAQRPDNTEPNQPIYRSVKIYVNIVALDGEDVLIGGIEPDDLLITGSINSLTDGYMVYINKE